MIEYRIKNLIRRNQLKEAEKIIRTWLQDTDEEFKRRGKGIEEKHLHELFDQYIISWLKGNGLGRVPLSVVTEYLNELLTGLPPRAYFKNRDVAGCFSGALTVSLSGRLLPGPLFPELPTEDFLNHFFLEEVFFFRTEEELIEGIPSLTKVNRDHFWRILRQATNLGVEIPQLAEILQVSPRTIHRWAEGKEAPSKAFMGSVFIAIKSILNGEENPFPALGEY